MLDTRRPFTRSDALASGFTPKQLRGARFRRLFHGVHVEARVPDHPLIRAQAVLLVHPASAMVSHTTAALVYGLPVRREAHEHVTVSQITERTRHEGIRCHVAPTKAAQLVDGVRVPPGPVLFVQLASLLSLVDLVVVGDAMVRRRLATVAELVAHTSAHHGRHSRTAARAASLVRARVDSPMESRLRLLLVLAGLPEPVVNLRIRDEAGREIRRVDLSYPEWKVAIEYDGRHHVKREVQWREDLDRREEFESDGWRVLVITSEDIYRDPARTIGRVHQALKARGADLPARSRAEWRAHFPA